MLGNFSFWEILLVFVLVLLLFGAKRIPEIAGSFGKGIREFKRSLTDVDRAIREPEAPEQQRVDAGRSGERLPADRPAAEEKKPEAEPKRLLG